MPRDPCEIFAIYTADNTYMGTAERQHVHRVGLYHRSVHVLVFNSHGALLVARRADDKDVCPGLWDVSCGEHVQPGESYEAAARRGLAEELRVTEAHLCRLRPARLQIYHVGDVHDREFVETWQVHYDGPLQPDASEVHSVQFMSVPLLVQRMASAVDALACTPWLRDEVAYLSDHPV